MFQKKNKFWYGIQFKTAGILLGIVLVSGVVLYGAVFFMINENIEQQIELELRTIRRNSEVCVRQILILNEKNYDEESYKENAHEILTELYNSKQCPIALYDIKGKYIIGYEETIFEKNREREDFRKALCKQTAYTIIYPKEKQCRVFLSVPVIIEDEFIGIIRYYFNYDQVLQRGEYLLATVFRMATGALAGISILIFIWIARLLKPIRELSHESRVVAEEMRKGKIPISKRNKLTEKKDETGELAKNYYEMLDTVERQFEKIQQDRDRILQLMDSKQEFFNNVTHELKTPLTTIHGYAQLIEIDKGEDQNLLEIGMNHILHESQRLHQMVIQLLELSDHEMHQEVEPVDISNVIVSVVNSMQLKAMRYENTIVFEKKDKLIVPGRENRIRQVIINLIDNAIKYGESGTEIKLIAEDCGECIRVQVINQGKGIAPEKVPYIFEPFYRVEKEYSREKGSAGLGLTICRKIMEEHKGTIQVFSIPEVETVFVLEFLKDSEEKF